jgi:hypothetical protein
VDGEDKFTVIWWVWALWVCASFILFERRKKRATKRRRERKRENKILLTTATMNFHIWKFNIAIVKKDATLQ